MTISLLLVIGIPLSLVTLLIGIVFLSKRHMFEAIGIHLRNSTRHILSGILLAGTASGTLWTFSNGSVSLNGILERVISVGGIALALEWGLILTGMYIGNLDQYIANNREKKWVAGKNEVSLPATKSISIAGIRISRVGKLSETKTEHEVLRAEIMHWFYAMAAVSGIANFIFRSQQLHNPLLAAFISSVPVLLVILLTIKLRPLPIDYATQGKQATKRSLNLVVESSSTLILRYQRRMAAGKTLNETEKQQYAAAMTIIGMFGDPTEIHTLRIAAANFGIIPEPTIVEEDVMIRVSDLVQLYGWSERTAQAKIKAVPGFRQVGKSFEAPESAVYGQFGRPPRGDKLALPLPSIKRKIPRNRAIPPQTTYMRRQVRATFPLDEEINSQTEPNYAQHPPELPPTQETD